MTQQESLIIPDHLYARNDILAVRDILFRILLFIGLFWVSIELLVIEKYILGYLFYLSACFVGSFFGWSGIGHELLHFSVFKSRKVNRAFLIVFSVYSWNNWIYHEISHRRHHRYTMKTGVDFEFDPRQKAATKGYLYLALFLDINLMIRAFVYTIKNSCSIVPGPLGVMEFARGTSNLKKVTNAAQIILVSNLFIFGIFFVFLGLNIAVLYLVSPFVFTSIAKTLALSQHYAMDTDEEDILKTTRSINLPPWLEFLYANMNYHVEHHLYPSVPYYNLPSVSKLINENDRRLSLLDFFKIVYPRG